MSNATSEVMPFREKHEIIVETLIMVVIFLIGVVGNPLTGFMIMRNERLRNLHNTLTINLILADSVATLLSMPPVIVTLAVGKWVFGRELCHIFGYTTFVLGICCLWTILWLSIMRLLMLTKPHVYARIVMPKYITTIIASIWVIAVMSGSSIYIEGTFEFKPNFAVCFFVYDDLGKMAAFMVPIVLMPLFVVCLLTVMIVYKMKQRHKIHGTVGYQEDRDIMKTYVILVLVYIACYLPVFVIEAEFASEHGSKMHHIIPIAATYLGLLPFSLKALIHVVTKKAFRNEMVAFFRSKNRVVNASIEGQSAWHTGMMQERKEESQTYTARATAQV